MSDRTFFIRNASLLRTARERLALCDNPYSDMCSSAIECILSRTSEYDAIPSMPSVITDHLLRMLPLLPDEDAVFSIYEDLVLVLRSYILHNPRLHMAAPERRLVEHFELCGEWHPGDGTLVSEWYWLRLPALALSQTSEAKRLLITFPDM